MFLKELYVIIIFIISFADASVYMVANSDDYFMTTQNGTVIVLRDGPTGFRTESHHRKASGTPTYFAIDSINKMAGSNLVQSHAILAVGQEFTVYAYAGMATLSSTANATDDPTFMDILSFLTEKNYVNNGGMIRYEYTRWRLVEGTYPEEEEEDLTSGSSILEPFYIITIFSMIFAMIFN